MKNYTLFQTLKILLNSIIARCRFCYFFFIIFKKSFSVFPAASSNDLFDTDIYALCYTARSRPRTMMRKINNIIHCKDIFNGCYQSINGGLLKWFSDGDNGLVCSQLLMLFSPGSIFL